jgi:hypothetical protein
MLRRPSTRSPRSEAQADFWNPTRYSLATAQHTLQLIATRMSQENTRDLAWWRIPTWTSALPRALTIGAASGLAVWLGFGLGITFDLFGRLGQFGGLIGIASGLVAYSEPGPPVEKRHRQHPLAGITCLAIHRSYSFSGSCSVFYFSIYSRFGFQSGSGWGSRRHRDVACPRTRGRFRNLDGRKSSPTNARPMAVGVRASSHGVCPGPLARQRGQSCDR